MPGGVVCSISSCTNNSRKTKALGENIRFFTFPKDLEIQKQWIQRCNRSRKFSAENKRVCSKHFQLRDFEDECRAKIMNIQPKQLKKTAIPSLCLPTFETHTSLGRPISEKQVIKPLESEPLNSSNLSDDEQRFLEEILEDIDDPPGLTETNQENTPRVVSDKEGAIIVELQNENNLNINTNDHENIMIFELEQTPPQQKSLQDENQLVISLSEEVEKKCEERFQSTIKQLEEDNEYLQRKNQELEDNCDHLQNIISELEQHVKRCDTSFEARVKVMFRNFLSPTQVQVIMKRKHRVRWTKDELTTAHALKNYFGDPKYRFLRNTLRYPLPGLSTLQKFAAGTLEGL